MLSEGRCQDFKLLLILTVTFIYLCVYTWITCESQNVGPGDGTPGLAGLCPLSDLTDL